MRLHLDALVESARNVDWKELNENPAHEDYPWAIGLILEKAVVMANELGYSPPTILSNEISMQESYAVSLLNVGGKYTVKKGFKYDKFEIHTHDGEVFIFKWEKPGKLVRQKNN